ncbi:MAG: DUF3459 domain-containing protein [Anaerolineaceae bacterium]|nr:MAG: DUF3459 domain-containing protein [Anaerolineaceae bacterium]
MWWKNGVIYQIYPRSFMDSSGDGIGDLRGAHARLDYLVDLGIDAIWFSPIFPSPQADFGYDVADYTGIHHEYGTQADFDALLTAAHARGIKIILDLVPNHTSSAHRWFVESRSSRDNPKRDWYIWKDPKPDGSPPNNWLSYFGGPAWTFDAHTGQYYMHNFDPGQPELNWRNPDMVAALFDDIRFWLRRGVDGFRIDVIDRIIKDAEFRDNPPNPNWKPGDLEVGSLSRVHSEAAPGIHDMIRQIRAVFDEFPGTVAIGELAYDLSVEETVAYYGAKREGENSGDGVHMPFNFGLLLKAWRADVFRAYVDEYDAAIPSFGWPNYVLGNHDIGRIASRYGRAQARVAALLLLTLRGTPTLYYGDEIGMTNTPIPEHRVLDPQGRNKAGFNRDECRTPMQWDDSPHAGFSTAPDTWLPVAPDYPQVNVAQQRAEPSSTLNFYRRALAYRRAHASLHGGEYASIDAPEGVFAYWRTAGDERHLVALNFTERAQTLTFDAAGGELVISTHPASEGRTLDAGEVALTADEGAIIRIR